MWQKEKKKKSIFGDLLIFSEKKCCDTKYSLFSFIFFILEKNCTKNKAC